MIVPKKSPGRPKKKVKLLEGKEKAANELFRAMKEYEYTFKGNIQDIISQRETRRQHEEFHDYLLQTPIFEENTQELVELATKYFEYFYIDELPKDVAEEVLIRKNLDLSLADLAELDPENDSEENREIIEHLAYKNTSRREYLEKKPPITSFIEGSLEELPIDKQTIIRDHWAEIFNEEVKYQEQVEKVIRLIYDPTPKSHSGPTAIGKLFGVSKGEFAGV